MFHREYVATVCQCEKGKACTVGDECGKRRCHPPAHPSGWRDTSLSTFQAGWTALTPLPCDMLVHKFVLTTLCSLMPKSYMITTTMVLFLFLFNYVLKTCCKTISACCIDRLLFLNLQHPPSPPACVFLFVYTFTLFLSLLFLSCTILSHTLLCAAGGWQKAIPLIKF